MPVLYGEAGLRDHNAGSVDPGCFMVYNRFQFHGCITNNKCRLLVSGFEVVLCTSVRTCTSEVTLTLASRLRKPLSLSDRTRAIVTFFARLCAASCSNTPTSSFTCMVCATKADILLQILLALSHQC